MCVCVFDGGIRPVINFFEGSFHHPPGVFEHNVEILKLVGELGRISWLPPTPPDCLEELRV